jgi:para-aminobenzoate synthetase component II
MIIIIDNYDSFTYNLVQHLGALGAETRVYRNDKISLEEIRQMRPEKIIISPGPCTPNEAGISNLAIKELGKEIPILGVCLGHQCIGQVYGGKVMRAGRPVHGKTSEIQHDGKTIYKSIPNPFTATRYHSLIIERETLPECLEISAENEEGLIMGVRHKRYPVEGVQFHPESILTKEGKNILKNFLNAY